MTAISFSAAARKALVVHRPSPSLDLHRYRRRWIRSRFGLSIALADVVAEMAFSNRRGPP